MNSIGTQIQQSFSECVLRMTVTNKNTEVPDLGSTALYRLLT